jgi:1-acyl-sn-glycerol-3-phosphate acyltransferase
LLYSILKIPARLLFRLYCRRLIAPDKKILAQKGPLLIAANHPNSLLDAIIVSALFSAPVYSLARGDVFNNKRIGHILRKLNILPVYRIREGADKLMDNYETFDSCIEIFKKNGIVLIFSEGLCINEWHLRPLKKGTARMALQAWDANIPLKILPLAINYSNFGKLGKDIHVYAGELIQMSDISGENFGTRVQQINQKISDALKTRVYEIPKTDEQKHNQYFNSKQRSILRTMARIPGILGALLYLPLYLPSWWIAEKYFKKNDHYDSVITGFLFLLCIPYWVILAGLTWHFWGLLPALILLIALPLLARCSILMTKG